MECGEAPQACPLSVFDDPFVGEVLSAFRMVRLGEHTNMASLAMLNPPERLYRGVDYYDRAVIRALSARRRREEAARQNANASRARGRR